MARTHARLHTSIWNDEEFRGLPPDAQHLYVTLMSQPALSYVGVIDFIPKRIAVLSATNTAARITAATKRLERGRFVVVDRDTDELLVRSYVRHDGVLDRSNMGKACARAYEKVTSLALKHAVIVELARLYRDSPSLPGWVGIKEISPEVMARVDAEATSMTLPV